MDVPARKGRRSLLRGGMACALALLGVAVLVPQPAAAGQRFAFEGRDLPAANSRLYDLGVTDRAGDGRLDVYTLNHFYPASFLERSAGAGLDGFRDRTYRLGLAQEPRFPGWERMLGVPEPPDRGPGLYAHLLAPDQLDGVRGRLVLESRGAGASGSVTLEPSRYARPVLAENAVVVPQEHDGVTTLHYSIAAGGRAEIELTQLDLGLRFAPAAGQALFLGARSVRAGAVPVRLALQDRHAYAAGDLDGDGRQDLVAVGGGLGGSIADPKYRGLLTDQLLLGRRHGFAPEPVSLPKGACRGRQADIVDADGDGRPEIFTACEGDVPDLLERRAAGGFSRRPIEGAEGSLYRWLQADRDAPPELLVAGDGMARVLELRRGDWTVAGAAPLRNGSAPVHGLSIADFDRDGDADVFAASPGGNTLLVGTPHGFEARRPASRGLPGRSLAAAWVDADLDGRIDLYAAPQGLFARRKQPARGFAPTGELARRATGRAFASWADLDNDGRRDLVAGFGRGEVGARQRVRAWRNRSRRRGAWLAVDVPGTLQTSRVVVRAGGRRWVGWAGQSDDSPHSQTHNRVYFGLGGLEVRGRHRVHLSVRTPDGDTIRRRARLDRIVSVG